MVMLLSEKNEMLIKFIKEFDSADFSRALNQADEINGENLLMKAIDLNNELV